MDGEMGATLNAAPWGQPHSYGLFGATA